MGLFSKCETISFRPNLKALLLLALGALATAAFFVPPEFCKLYFELCKEFEYLRHFDKVFHFMFFTGVALNIPLTRNILGKLLIFLLLIALGIGIEAIQYYTPHRGASPQDLMANTLGVFFGFMLRLLKH